jgi:hypothetical protein
LADIVDPIGFELSGAQYQAGVAALVSAFPSPSELAAMVKFRLNLQLGDVVSLNAGMREIVFNLIQHQLAQGHFLRLIDAARGSRPGNPKLAFFAEQFALSLQTVPHNPKDPPAPELQKIVVKTNSMLPIALFRERLGEIEACVCRIEVSRPRGPLVGTGFLIGPDRVLTNYHIVESILKDPEPPAVEKINVCFDYKQLPGGGVSEGTSWKISAIVDRSRYAASDRLPWPQPAPPTDQLDYAVLQLETPPLEEPVGKRPIGVNAEDGAPQRGWIALPDDEWAFTESSPLFIVQHPAGAPMQLALQTDAILDVNGNRTRVRYKTNTMKGSSGSPCFNQHLELVALHHAGDPTGPIYQPGYNAGIPISTIVRLMRERKTLPGAAAV